MDRQVELQIMPKLYLGPGLSQRVHQALTRRLEQFMAANVPAPAAPAAPAEAGEDVSFSLRNFSLFAHATTFLAKTVLGLVFQTAVNKPRLLLRVICFLEIR